MALVMWFAENLATFGRACRDPAEGWRPVSAFTRGSWYLLMIISFVLVAPARRRSEAATASRIL